MNDRFAEPNEKQLAALTELARGIVSDYKQLDITEILNRMNYITGRDFKKCIEGFKIMYRVGLIKPDFVLNAHKLPKLEATIGLIFPLMQSLDAELVKPGDKVAEKFSKADPMVQKFNLQSDGPVDDAEAVLPHLDSNF